MFQHGRLVKQMRLKQSQYHHQEKQDMKQKFFQIAQILILLLLHLICSLTLSLKDIHLLHQLLDQALYHHHHHQQVLHPLLEGLVHHPLHHHQVQCSNTQVSLSLLLHPSNLISLHHHHLHLHFQLGVGPHHRHHHQF